MLILSHADALGVDLHQFGKGIHQTTSYRDSATNRHILIRELLASRLRGRIDGCTVLTDRKDLGHYSFATRGSNVIATCEDILNEVIGLATGCAIADGDGFNLVFLYHLLNGDSRLRAFVYWRMGEDGIVVQQITLCIEADHLTPCTEARVDAHHTFLTKWRTQQ